MKRWEYKVEDKRFDETKRIGAAYAILRDKEEADWLNVWDEEGWELVAVSSIHSVSGFNLGNRYYFRKWRV